MRYYDFFKKILSYPLNSIIQKVYITEQNKCIIFKQVNNYLTFGNSYSEPTYSVCKHGKVKTTKGWVQCTLNNEICVSLPVYL